MNDKPNSKPLNVTELARQSGIPYSTLCDRLARNGGDVAKALAEPRHTPREAGRLGARKSPWRHP